jgi:alanyl-tRNA synthetase
VGSTVEDLAAAKARGVTALFGEKYEDRVRVVAVGDWSTELCGGTHVRAAGDIGPVLILSERAVQAGVRRIEAVAGTPALRVLQAQRRLLSEAAQSLKVAPDELVPRIAALQTQLKEAKKQQTAGAQADLGALLTQVRAGLSSVDGLQVGALDLPQLDREGLRELGQRSKSLGPDLAVAYFGREGDKVPFLILCEGAALGRGLAANTLASTVSRHLGGRGGGRPDSAQGQGADGAALPGLLAALGKEMREAAAKR